MFKAKYNGKVINAKDYTGNGQGLTCIHCNARLDFVHRHNREGKTVHPFFRLNRNSCHEESCRFNIEHLLKDAYNQLGTDIMGHNCDKYILRLQHSENNYCGKSKILGSSGNSVDKTVQNRECKHKKYIRTLFKILSIYIEMDKNPELRNKLTIQFDGENITWNDFFYEEKDLKKMYKACPIEHPIVVFGKIKGLKQRNGEQYVDIQCQEGDKTYVIKGKLRFSLENMGEQLKNESYCLLYFDEVNKESSNLWNSIKYINMEGSIQYQEHICIVKIKDS